MVRHLSRLRGVWYGWRMEKPKTVHIVMRWDAEPSNDSQTTAVAAFLDLDEAMACRGAKMAEDDAASWYITTLPITS